MSDALTIVMYHYVRPIAASAYPRIRGLELQDFEGQLDYIEAHYTVISAADLVAARAGGPPLPPMPLLLTFDDGYRDHAAYVWPVLKRRGLTGVFFPPARCVLERRLLDVNKIHFLLATVEDVSALIAPMEAEASSTLGSDVVAELRQTFRVANRFDSADVIYFKRMLQVALPETLRQAITDDLFRRYVHPDSAAFADTLYMNEADLRTMVADGMELGGHGDTHVWLDRLSLAAQAAEIDASHALLRAMGMPQESFYFCYPYGGYNADTLEVLSARHCAAAFTTKVGLVRATDSMLELARIDTNDLPRTKHAPAAAWTQQARGLIAQS